MMNRTPVALIVAVDLNNGISREGQIPWKIKEDVNFFQDVTKRSYEGKKNAIIIGRNTWKAFPLTLRGLKDRINIVVSSTMSEAELKADNVTGCEAYLTKSLREALDLATSLDPGKTFICGGNNIYKEALENSYCDELYLTRIFSSFLCDNKFPYDDTYILHNYRLICYHSFEVTEKNIGKKVDIEICKYVKSRYNLTHQITNQEEQQYLDLLEYILKKGHYRQTRNSNTWSVIRV